jgi:4a-hydroxytetrahydrobiopterin dehydratase
MPNTDRTPLNEADIQARLVAYPDWQLYEGGLEANFTFPDFANCWAAMAQIAQVAEALDHHPDWQNVYNRLRIRLWTHDAGGITPLDFKLLEQIETHVRHHQGH